MKGATDEDGAARGPAATAPGTSTGPPGAGAGDPPAPPDGPRRRRAPPWTAAGLLVLAAAALVSHLEQRDQVAARARAAEPLAAALAPLGPAKAVLSTVLWTQLQRHRVTNDADATMALSRALLALHPELESVREHLALQLILTDAALSGDAAQQRAAVLTGLTLLEEGLELRDSPRLHGTLGQVLALQLRHDPRRREVAAQYFGAPPEAIAIQELRAAGNPVLAPLLAELLLERGRSAFDRQRDLYAARRDLGEARRLVDGMLPERHDPAHRRQLDAAVAELDALLTGEDERP